jgi:hypothetical protein
VVDDAVDHRGDDDLVPEYIAQRANIRFRVRIIEACSYREDTSWENTIP